MGSKFSRIYAGERKQWTQLINASTSFVHTYVASATNGRFSLLIWLCLSYLTSSVRQMWMATCLVIIIIVFGIVRHLDVETCDCQCNGNLPGIVSQMKLTSSPSSSITNLALSFPIIIVADAVRIECDCAQSIHNTYSVCVGSMSSV